MEQLKEKYPQIQHESLHMVWHQGRNTKTSDRHNTVSLIESFSLLLQTQNTEKRESKTDTNAVIEEKNNKKIQNYLQR